MVIGMGVYRFLLSMMVLFSHAERCVTIRGTVINQGRIAVISFLIITGFTNAGSLERYRGKLSSYYLRRIIRIWFPYAAVSLLAYLSIGLFHIPYETIPEVTFSGALLDILLLPWMIVPEAVTSLAIPAAWTVVTQMKYYLISPVVRMLNAEKSAPARGIVLFFFVLSFALFCLSCLGLISRQYSDMNLWGVLWIFLSGAFLAVQGRTRKGLLTAVWILCGIASAFSLWKITREGSALLVNPESVMGFFLGLPAVVFCRNLRRTWWDDLLGALSYGIFLCHFPIKCLLVYFAGGGDYSRALLVVLSVLGALLLHLLVERPARKIPL